MRARKSLGWIPDTPDARDHLYEEPAGKARQLPAQVDLRPRCPPVQDQGLINACTAHVVASAHHFDQLRQGVSAFPPSRLFIYWNERVRLGLEGQDSGATIRGGIKSIGRLGVCPEPLWDYDSARVLLQPPEACYAAALPHRAVAYRRIPRKLRLLRVCLAEGWPFAFGFTTFEEFHSPQVAQTGVLPMPRAGEPAVGGHAVLAVGYDASARTFLAMNSWGCDWGQAGFFTIPWDYLLHEHWCRDFWTVRDVTE